MLSTAIQNIQDVRDSVEHELSQMLEDGIIQHDDETSYNSLLVIVKKKR